MMKYLRKKAKGSLLIAAALSAIVFMLIASSFATMFSAQFSTLDAGRTATKAQRYAEIEANTLTLTPYDDLHSLNRQAITDVAEADGWQKEVVIGPEKVIGDDNKQRIATVKIYRDGETQPRYTTQLPLSTQGNRTSISEFNAPALRYRD